MAFYELGTKKILPNLQDIEMSIESNSITEMSQEYTIAGKSSDLA